MLEEGELSDEIFSEEILLKGAFAEGMSGAAERDRYGMAVRAEQAGPNFPIKVESSSRILL